MSRNRSKTVSLNSTVKLSAKSCVRTHGELISASVASIATDSRTDPVRSGVTRDGGIVISTQQCKSTA